jgi:hypothetical protein
LREERSQLIEAREKRGRHTAAVERQTSDQSSRSAERSTTNDNKREETEAAVRVGGHREGETEMTDAKQMKVSKSQEIEAAYAKRDAQKPAGLDRSDGGRGGR